MAKFLGSKIAIAVGGAVIGGVGYGLLPVRPPRAPAPVAATTAADVKNNVSTLAHENSAGAESNPLISFEDSLKLFKVQIHRTLIGQPVVDQGFFRGFEYDDVKKMGKTLVYFDVSVTNLKGSDAQNLEMWDFTLEDTKGNSYPSKQPTDWIHGEAHVGRTGRGGIGFHIYQGEVPAVLIYDVHYVNKATGEKIYARSPRLDGARAESR